MRAMIWIAVTLAILTVTTGSATAQPCIPFSATDTFVDLGDVGIGGPLIRSADIPIASGGHVWFRFNLTSGIAAPVSWFDLDTARSTIDTEMCLYDCRGNKIEEDGDSGGHGPATTYNSASALTIGAGSGERLGADGADWPGARISDGSNYVNFGLQLPTLDAGIYYVAVVGYNADFTQDPNVNWQVSTMSTAVGTVRLRLSTGFAPQTYWNERCHAVDAGSTISTAQVVEGYGPLTTIVTAFSATGSDMFKINVCDPANFRVTATPTSSDVGVIERVRLYIFDATGRGVVAINNTLAQTTTTLTLPPGSPAGDYYVAVSDHCRQGTPVDAPVRDAQGRPIWDFNLSSTWNVRLSPNGSGAASPLSYWTRLGSAACDGNGIYYTKLAFDGACHIAPPPGPPGCGSADFNGDGDVATDADIEAFFRVLAGGHC